MSWRDRTVIRILLFIALFVSEETIREELKHLINYINLSIPRTEEGK